MAGGGGITARTGIIGPWARMPESLFIGLVFGSFLFVSESRVFLVQFAFIF